jgi:hypothetical protein
VHDAHHEAEASGLHSLERKVRLGFAIAATVLVLIGLLSYFSVVRFRSDTRRVNHTHQVLNSLTELLWDLTVAESSQRKSINKRTMPRCSELRNNSTTLQISLGTIRPNKRT